MEIEISVRNLVEFILREGDIDNRHAKRAAENAMQEGSRIHRMIQKKMGIEYEPEVWLSCEIPCDNYMLKIEGRADGVIHHDNQVIIDEIKGTYRKLEHIKEPVAVHLAQAKCYAYIVMMQESLLDICVRMTYCNIDTEEIKYFHVDFTRIELSAWFDDLIEQYRKWADFEYEWKMLRQESIKQLEFPYEYRDGQKELAGHVYQTICHKRKLFIQAPTGTGKTITTIFPAVKAVGQQKADRIFYLTAKTITRTVAEDTFALLKETGLKYKTVTITAKEKICPLDECSCNPEDCPYAKGHYSRINDAIYDLLTTADSFTRPVIEEYSQKHMVCPFEMSLDMSLFSDGVICDYNYLFDPYVHLKRFFTEGIKGPYLFLIDEAHNLVDRGRQMYSASLIKEDFLALKGEIKEYNTGLEKHLDRCNKQLLELKKMSDGMQVLESAGAFDMSLTRLHAAISDYLEDHENSPVYQELLDFYFDISRYLDVNEQIDKNYVTYTQLTSEGEFMIKQLCVNPAKRLKECMDQGVSTTLFSATFLPIQYYKQLLGGDPEDFEVYAKTAFRPEQMKVMIGTEVTSKYTRRNEQEYRNIAAYISAIVRAKQGNYMVFCPSHQFLEAVYDAFMDEYYDSDTQECMIQTNHMDETAREEFLRSFSVGDGEAGDALFKVSKLISMDIQEENQSVIGFCVLGGIFSEGIDLKGESLIGSIIVGTGLPQVCFEQEILKDYFDRNQLNGFDYAYRYPGMNKVLQAAGRVIRTSSDRGVIALLDERFMQNAYQRMFPREWSDHAAMKISDCEECIKIFWGQEDL